MLSTLFLFLCKACSSSVRWPASANSFIQARVFNFSNSHILIFGIGQALHNPGTVLGIALGMTPINNFAAVEFHLGGTLNRLDAGHLTGLDGRAGQLGRDGIDQIWVSQIGRRLRLADDRLLP